MNNLGVVSLGPLAVLIGSCLTPVDETPGRRHISAAVRFFARLATASLLLSWLVG